MMLDPELRKEIIMENYLNPVNKDTIEDKNYLKVNTNSETCIDNIDLYILFDGDVIKNLHFNGEACAISTSASSIMIKLLIGKTIKEAKEIMKNYYNMVHEKEYDENLLGEACCYEDIHKQQNRIGCATIPWRGLEKAFEEYEKRLKEAN